MNYELGTIRFRAIMDNEIGISSLGTFDGAEVFGTDGRLAKELWIQPYEMADQRTLWPDKDSDKKGILCSSDDGVTGDGEPGGECARCPFSRKGCGVKRFVECYASLVDPESDDYDPMDTEMAVLVIGYKPPRPGAKPNTTMTTARVVAKMVEKHVNNIDEDIQWIKLTGISHSSGSVTYARMDIG